MRSRTFYARLALTTLTAILLLLVAAQPPALAAADPAAKEAELKQVRSRIESIRKSIQAEAERRDSLATQVRRADLDVQSARQRLTDVRQQRQAAQARLQELQTERTETERKIEDERESLANELRVAYINGRQEQTKLLLNQQNPAQLGRMMVWYAYFGRARADRLTAIGEHLAHIDLLSEKITAEAAQLQELEEEQSRQVSALASARDKRRTTLAEVQSRIRNRNDELAKAQRDAQALEKLVEQLRKAIQEFPDLGDAPFAKVRGKLPWPTKGPLLARFGQLRAGGPLKWQGVVIGADRGAQVRAPFPGRVVYADWLPGLGLLLVLDHGGGFMSLYGHNEQLYRRVGDRVSPGDLISVVGDAPGFGKPGLYLEIRKGRDTLDPLPWLTKP
ncbi:MAG: murein hydrolase activator EnvC family protein [Povalibacter sp.]